MDKIQQEIAIGQLLKQMTLEEKTGMVHGAGLFRTEGIKRLGIPPVFMSDGPMGVRAEFKNDAWINSGTTEDYVTYLPCNSALASTWNRKLALEMGRVLGEETRGRGKDVILAPGINVKRSPLCGRNFEYMSEDPYLIEEMAVPMVKGIQESDVAACAKHFAANGQEKNRVGLETVVSERALQEIYYPGFKALVEKAGLHSIMGAYNKINGEYCCTGRHLLNDVLRKQWHFDGTVISDWGGVHDTKEALESGLDIEMHVTNRFSEYYLANPMIERVKSGELSEECLNEKVRNILRMMMRLKMIGPGKQERKSGSYNTPEHRKTVLDVAREGVILLKNQDQKLPVCAASKRTVAVIGQNAAAIHSNGGGSAEIKALYEISPLMGIKKLLGGNHEVTYVPGYFIPDREENAVLNWQAYSMENLTSKQEKEQERKRKDIEKRIAVENKRLQEEAVALAKSSDIVIFVGGLNHEYDLEGRDRSSMELPYGQDELIEELLRIRDDMIVVIFAGSPVKMPWIDQAKAVVWSYYNGMEGGTAIAEVLFGKVNPSGKLAETFIRSEEQCPAHRIGTFGKEDSIALREGVMVGYRCYDTENTDVLFPFGHGLSYSSFTYEDMECEKAGEEGLCRVSLTVANAGEIEGKETVQLYIAPKGSAVIRPAHELKAFEKVMLLPKESKRISFLLMEKDFSVYAEEKNTFVLQRGLYEIRLGASSRDIRLKMDYNI